MSLPAKVQVLIVGAGPTGLVAALTLAELGLQVAIVDSLPQNQNGSRAAVVHAHTLEVLHPATAKLLIESGICCDSVLLRGSTNKILEVDLSQLRDVTEFPFSLLIPQHEVERIFRERLASRGIHIFSNQTAVGLRQSDHGGVDVSFEDGGVINTQYIVGADGSRSMVRRVVGIEFVDPHTGVSYDDRTVPPSFHIVLADAHLEDPIPGPIPRDSPSIHLNDFLLLLPLREKKGPESEATLFWRIAFILPVGEPKPPKTPSMEYLQQMLDARNPWGTRMTISSVFTSSSYRVRAAVAGTYFHKLGDGNILLAGDAAHVHSPAGGQGMNLGICDAVAVAHAIHSHSESKDLERRDDILQQYAETRRRIGVRVVGLTRGLTTLVNAGTGWRKILRDLILRVVSFLPFVNRHVAWRLSGLANREG